MILKVYSVYDQKTNIYNTPFYNSTHGEAERNFKDAVNEPNSRLGAHPEDYTLAHIGEYDDNTGKLTSLKAPDHMLPATQVKKDYVPEQTTHSVKKAKKR